MNGNLELWGTLVNGASEDELASVGIMIASRLNGMGRDVYFGSLENAVNAGLPSLVNVSAKPKWKADYWMKRVDRATFDAGKSNGYAFSGPWIKGKDVGSQPDGTLVAVGYTTAAGEKQYLLMKRVVSGVTVFSYLKNDGSTDTARFEGYEPVALSMDRIRDYMK